MHTCTAVQVAYMQFGIIFAMVSSNIYRAATKIIIKTKVLNLRNS